MARGGGPTDATATLPATDGDITVLHVEDDPDFAEVTADRLVRERPRFSVEHAADAAEGLETLATTDVDCVLSDFDMPGMDGIEFLQAVREDHPDLPFVLFTGHGSEGVASEAFTAGATDYLQKGRGTEQYTLLANRIENYVEQARTRAEQRRRLETLETAEEALAILDADGRIRYVNRACADIHGYEPDGMVGRHWEAVYPEETRAFVREIAEAHGWTVSVAESEAGGARFEFTGVEPAG